MFEAPVGKLPLTMDHWLAAQGCGWNAPTTETVSNRAARRLSRSLAVIQSVCLWLRWNSLDQMHLTSGKVV